MNRGLMPHIGTNCGPMDNRLHTNRVAATSDKDGGDCLTGPKRLMRR